MSADRFEITATDILARVEYPNGCAADFFADGSARDRFAFAAIRQQARDISQLRAECDLLTHKVICCGVAAWHSDPLLTTTGAYAGKWNSPQADCVRKLRADLDQLRADLAAAVAENAALLAANRDCIWHFDAIKADYDAMKLRAEQAEARLTTIDNAPTVAVIHDSHGHLSAARAVTRLPDEGTELIARPAKD